MKHSMSLRRIAVTCFVASLAVSLHAVPSRPEAKANRYVPSVSMKDKIIERDGVQLKISATGTDQYSFEITDSRIEPASRSTGSLAYSDSELHFTVQDQNGQEAEMKVTKAEEGIVSIQLAFDGASTRFSFNGGLANELVGKMRAAKVKGSVNEVRALAPRLVSTISPFGRYRTFVKQEIGQSQGIASLAFLFAKGDYQDGEVVQVLQGVSKLLAPSVHLAARAAGTGPRATKISYTVQADAQCVSACASFAVSFGIAICGQLTPGSPEWWACVGGDVGLTAFCFYQCGGQAN